METSGELRTRQDCEIVESGEKQWDHFPIPMPADQQENLAEKDLLFMKCDPRTHHHALARLEDYEPHIGGETLKRLRIKAERLLGARVAHVNSTFYGGGVAELLSSLTLLMSDAGLATEWRAILGRSDYFSITKKMHNALQGAEINLTELKMEIYEQVAYENSVRNILDHDFVVIHDPQPLPLIMHYKKHGPWIWRCHLNCRIQIGNSGII